MKRLYSLFVVLAAMWATVPFASATTGPEAVNRFCRAFDNMAVQVDNCRDFTQIENLDFDKAIETAGVNTISDDCEDYVLTSTDKKKIQASFDGFVEAMVNKMYDLTSGMIGKAELRSQFDPLKNNFKSALDSSRTFGDLVNALDRIFAE